MAVVRISHDLVRRTVRNAEALVDKEVYAAQRTDYPKWGDKIYRRIIPQDVEALMRTLPYGALQYIDELNITSINGVHVNSTIPLAPARPWPFNVTAMSDAIEHTHYSNWLTLKTGDQSLIEVTTYAEECKRVLEAAQQKRNNMADTTRKFLQSHSTLAPALRKWPALWELLPEDIQERHKAPKPQREEQVMEEHDLTQLTSTITARRLTGEDK